MYLTSSGPVSLCAPNQLIIYLSKQLTNSASAALGVRKQQRQFGLQELSFLKLISN